MISLDFGLKINEIFEYLGCGKYIICYVELIYMFGGLVVDILGFSLFEFIDIEEEELGYIFFEMREKSFLCKFRGCLYLKELKCVVK